MEANTMWTDRATKIRLHVPEDSDEFSDVRSIGVNVVLLIGTGKMIRTRPCMIQEDKVCCVLNCPWYA